MKRRIFLSIILVTVLLFSCFNVKEEAKAATSRTQDEAMAWVKSLVGQSIVKDGSYGAQCVDLILAYYDFFGVPRASGNGADYATNALPSGWQRIQGAVPQTGDILVYTGGYGGYGHVGIFESAYSHYHQNVNGQYVEHITWRYDGFATPYWGVIRPVFSGKETNQFGAVSVSSVTETNAYISTTLNNLTYITSCGFYISTDGSNFTKAKTETVNGNVLNIFYNIETDYQPLSAGTRYYYKFFYNTGSGGYFESSVGSFTTSKFVDTEAPKVTGLKILHTGDEGYSTKIRDCVSGHQIVCDVSDNVAVASVEFELVVNKDNKVVTVEGEIIDGKAYPVNSNSFTYGRMTQVTAYAYDAAGNKGSASITHDYDDTAPVIDESSLKITQLNGNKAKISVEVTEDESEMARVGIILYRRKVGANDSENQLANSVIASGGMVYCDGVYEWEYDGSYGKLGNFPMKLTIYARNICTPQTTQFRGEEHYDSNIYASGIYLIDEGEEEITLSAGGTFALDSPTIQGYGTDIWYVVDPDIASVASDGTLTAKKAGKTIVLLIKANATNEYVEDSYTVMVNSGGEAEYSQGDVNEDRDVDIRDCRIILRGLCGKITLSERQCQLADVVEDGEVDIRDLRRLLLCVCGKLTADEL